MNGSPLSLPRMLQRANRVLLKAVLLIGIATVPTAPLMGQGGLNRSVGLEFQKAAVSDSAGTAHALLPKAKPRLSADNVEPVAPGVPESDPALLSIGWPRAIATSFFTASWSERLHLRPAPTGPPASILLRT